MDRQVAGREDKELADLMDKFVTVRVIQGWDMDLSIFQFDYELTWAVFLMNADKTIYGRYGSRSDHKNTSKDISIEGLRKAMEGALELHAAYPGNKKDLAGKTGPKVPFPTPESIPEVRGKPFAKPADGTRGGCIHCHNAIQPDAWTLRNAKQPVPDKTLWQYPMPDKLGLAFDTKERATVATVAPGSPADKAGFKAGDVVRKMEGQPILSIADVQWVLHMGKEPGSVKAEVDRGGQKMELTLALAAGWRHADDFTWRLISWSMRHRLMGTEPLELVPADEKKSMGIPDAAMAIRVQRFPPDWVKEKNPQGAQKLKQGDVIVDVDGNKKLTTEAELLAYLFQKKQPGQSATLTVLRGGKPQQVQLQVP